MTKTGSINSSTTQEFLDVYDIANNFIILKNGTVSIVLTVNSMNFGLLAEAEQDAIIYAYAALLNSLNYPIQIMIQSKTKDATAYLNTLKQQEKKTSTANKKELIARYRQFVGELIRERNVLDKKFYVVVPATAIELGIMTAQSVLPGGQKFDITTIEKSILLEKAATTLEPKRDHLLAQFSRIGLYARQLETQEIIQIFYNNYNPESYEGQAITDTNNYTTPLVQAQIIGGNMNFTQPKSNNGDTEQAVTTPQTPATLNDQTTSGVQTTQVAQANPAIQTNPVTQVNQTAVVPAAVQTTQQQSASPAPGIQESVSNLNIPNADQTSAVSSSEQVQKTTSGQQTQKAAEPVNKVASKQASVSEATVASTTPSAPAAPADSVVPATSVVPTTPIARTTSTSPTTPAATTKPANLDLAQNTINQSLQDLGSTGEQQSANKQEASDQKTKTNNTQQTPIPPQTQVNLTKQFSEKLSPLPEI